MIGESIEKIVEDIRKLTMLTGQLSVVHEQTLEKWPYILFNNVKNVAIQYDLTKEYTQEMGEGYIVYDIDIDEIPDDAKDRANALLKWSRDLFWKEIRIEVTLNQQLIINDSTVELKPTPKLEVK